MARPEIEIYRSRRTPGVVVTTDAPPTETQLWFVLDPNDKGPAFGPVLDAGRAREYAQATGGVLCSVAADVHYFVAERPTDG